MAGFETIRYNLAASGNTPATFLRDIDQESGALAGVWLTPHRQSLFVEPGNAAPGPPFSGRVFFAPFPWQSPAGWAFWVNVKICNGFPLWIASGYSATR